MAAQTEKRFRAKLERLNSPLKWVIIRIPFDVAKAWGVGGRVKVAGKINGFAFRTSLFPSRQGGHILLVNKQMQAGAKATPGTLAHFQLAEDTKKRVASVPAELQSILREYPALQRWFGKLNYSTRKATSDWIGQVKSLQARVRRAEQLAERFLETMEAERELPPILRIASSDNRRAYEGWRRMSPSQRRGQLLAVFYYRTPDSRARRVAKLMDDAKKFAEKRAE